MTSEKIRKQYSAAYGPYAPGDYKLGDTIQTREYTGKVIWSYRSDQGLTYVINDGSGFPVEALASSVVAKK